MPSRWPDDGCRGWPGIGSPAEPAQAYATVVIEGHPLVLQQDALVLVGTGPTAGTDAALGIDHPVPGHVGVVEGRQGIAHLTGAPWAPGEAGHLAVGRDPSRGDAPHHRIYRPIDVPRHGLVP